MRYNICQEVSYAAHVAVFQWLRKWLLVGTIVFPGLTHNERGLVHLAHEPLSVRSLHSNCGGVVTRMYTTIPGPPSRGVVFCTKPAWLLNDVRALAKHATAGGRFEGMLLPVAVAATS